MKTHISDFEDLSMRAILNLDKQDSYGMQIKRFLQEEAKRPISYGALYEALTRLEKRGFVTSHLEEGGEERGGQPKRFFEVTESGIQALQDAEIVRDRLPITGLKVRVTTG